MTTTTATAVPAVVSKRRDLPEKIIVGYTTRCSDQVVDAVRNGVNVVIWSFVELVLPDINDTQEQVQCVAHFDLDCVKRMIQRLDLEGYTDTVHLVSFGKIFQMRDFFGCGFDCLFVQELTYFPIIVVAAAAAAIITNKRWLEWTTLTR